jgi:hypothetical protein
MCAKRNQSLIERRVRQTGQEGVRAQCRLPNKAWPVRGYGFCDDLMVPRREAGGGKVRLDLIAGRQVRRRAWPASPEKAWHDDIVFAGSGVGASLRRPKPLYSG